MALPISGQAQQINSGSQEDTTQSTNTIGASNSTNVASGSASGSQQGTTANTYQPWQTGLQAAAGGAAQNYLQTGNLPGTFGAPPQVTQAYIDNFNRSVAPQLAAQYGAGSPAIGSQLALGLEQLQAQTYQTQSANFSNALGQAGGLGFTAVGNTSSGTNQASNNAVSDTASTDWQDSTQTQNIAGSATNYGQTSPTGVPGAGTII